MKNVFLIAGMIWMLVPGNCPAALIKGTITDSLTSEPVARAVVKVKGTTDSALTDTAGRFTLNTTGTGIGPVMALVPEKLPDAAAVNVFGPDGRLVRTGLARELSTLPDGIYLLAWEENASARAGKLVKAGTLCQAGLLQPGAVGKAAANVTLVFTQIHHRSKEQAAAEGDTNVQARLAQKKGWELDSTMVGLAGVGVNKSSLTDYTGSSKPPAGSRISGKRITYCLDLSLGNIIIEKCFIQPTSGGAGMPLVTTTDFNQFIPVPSKVIIRDCEIDGTRLKSNRPDFDDIRFRASIAGYTGIADVRRCWIHGMGTGMVLIDAGTQLDCLNEQNVVTNMIPWGDPATTGSHNNAFSIRDFTDAQRPNRVGIVRNNRLELYTPNNASSALQISGTQGLTTNITAENNLLDGYGVCLWLSWSNNGYKNIKAINNRFIPRAGIGYESWSERGWTVYQDNALYDPTKPPECKGAPK